MLKIPLKHPAQEDDTPVTLGIYKRLFKRFNKMHIYIKHYFRLGSAALVAGAVLCWLLNDPGRYVYFLLFLGMGLLTAAFIRPNRNVNY